MPTRLTLLEQTALALNTARTPRTLGTVAIFDPPEGGGGYDELVKLIADRIRYVPRYRQRVLDVWFRLSGPVWVDSGAFDLHQHVRRSVLPRPGTRQQLHDIVAEIVSQPVDRMRPLWQVRLIEGLSDGRFALVFATHQSVVDGIDTVDLAQVLTDDTPSTAESADDWNPMPEPTGFDLLARSVTEMVQDPRQIVTNAAHGAVDAFGLAASVGDAVGAGEIFDDLAADLVQRDRGMNTTALSATPGPGRRFSAATAALDDLAAVRAQHGSSVHAVILAMITGGLRSWLMNRGQPLPIGSTVTAMAPLAVTDDAEQPTALGINVVPQLTTLPIGKPDALNRLRQLGRGHPDAADEQNGTWVPASEMTRIAGFAAPTLHALGVRAADSGPRRPYDLLIANVPGAQQRLYVGPAEMVASYPVVPLSAGHALAIGVTSYNGTVCCGLTGDRDAVSDLDDLAQGMTAALQELLDTTGDDPHAPPQPPPTNGSTDPGDDCP